MGTALLSALAGALAAMPAAWIAIVAIALLSTLAIAKAAGMLAARAASDLHVRGARVQVPAALRHRANRRPNTMRRAPPKAMLQLGGIRIDPADETRHFKLIGTTGTGKSTAIASLLRGALARGDRAVIADANGAFRERFFDRLRGDVLLNPLERGSVRWELFDELRSTFDAENLARGLIPECDDAASREWRNYARTLVGALIRRSVEYGATDLRELWRLFAVSDTGELRAIVAGTPAQPFLDPDNARMFSSIRSVAVSALAALPHVASCRGRPFAIRDWISHGRGVLFMPYRADQIAALRSLISTWVRLAIFETLSGAGCEPVTRRIWFVVDELDALGAIDGLTDALARLRKFGGRCVLGFQAAAQVSRTYGADGARALMENCGNTLILRCSASESGGTASLASQLIGEREVLRRQTVRSRDRSELLTRRGTRRSTQVARQRTTEAAVLPSEIEQLPDLLGYLKTASSPLWTLIRLAPEDRWWPSTTWE